jgi:hypothetical protein
LEPPKASTRSQQQQQININDKQESSIFVISDDYASITSIPMPMLMLMPLSMLILMPLSMSMPMPMPMRCTCQAFFGPSEIMLPVYPSVAAATASHSNASVFINYSSFRSAYESSDQALDEPTIQTVHLSLSLSLTKSSTDTTYMDIDGCRLQICCEMCRVY